MANPWLTAEDEERLRVMVQFMPPPRPRGPPRTNDEMVDDLVRHGVLRTREVEAAFRTIDRKHFWVEEYTEAVYSDVPLRSGFLHLSAPQIYAEALEYLQPLQKGMTFLNVGSGTGYFSAIVAEQVGDRCTHHGIDDNKEVVKHAEERLSMLGKRSIDLFDGNLYQLDVQKSMRYDRIYLGACANSKSKYIYELLEVGGVLVGPFQKASGEQNLRRVTRRSESRFDTEILDFVRFAPLREPNPDREDPRRGLGCRAPGLPGVRFTFSLMHRPWSPDTYFLFPASFRRMVAQVDLMRPRCMGRRCFLPNEVWLQHIFPWCTRRWFEPSHNGCCITKASPALSFSPAPRKVGEESDTEVSTQAPSSTASSLHLTPELGPVAMEELSELPPAHQLPQAAEAGQGGGVMVEVFSNGYRHQVGIDEDPDDTPRRAMNHWLTANRVSRWTGFHPEVASDGEAGWADDDDDDSEPDSVPNRDQDQPFLEAPPAAPDVEDDLEVESDMEGL